MSKVYYLVAVNTPFNHSMLTYGFESESDNDSTLPQGTIVSVPLGKRTIDGCIWQLGSEAGLELKKIKDISKINPDIFLSKIECELYQWMSNYYHYPLGRLIFDTLPTLLKKPT